MQYSFVSHSTGLFLAVHVCLSHTVRVCLTQNKFVSHSPDVFRTVYVFYAVQVCFTG